MSLPATDSPFGSGSSRRSFLKSCGCTFAAVGLGGLPALPQPNRVPANDRPKSSRTMHVSLKLNGTECAIDVEPRAVLLDVIREQLNLPGTKKGCDHGQCGACTVLVNGRRVLSCLSIAVMHDGHEITTIEGLERDGKLHPMQEAFLDCDAFQCGACTSGQIMSAVGMSGEPVGRDDHSVRHAMSGNLCRCGAYKHILEAVQRARDASRA